MFSDPVKNIEQCGIQPGMDIADFGSGSGHYSIASAKALMSTGRVHAIDVHKDLLTKLKNQASKEGLYNIEVILGDIEKPNGTRLRDGSVDLVLICNVLFQVEHKDSVIKEAMRVLKPAGRALVVDWEDSFGGLGPHRDMVFNKEKAISAFEKLGFHIERGIQAGSHHYGFICKKL